MIEVAQTRIEASAEGCMRGRRHAGVPVKRYAYIRRVKWRVCVGGGMWVGPLAQLMRRVSRLLELRGDAGHLPRDALRCVAHVPSDVVDVYRQPSRKEAAAGRRAPLVGV